MPASCGGLVLLMESLWIVPVRRDNQDENPYCLTDECSRRVSCCLMKDAPIASWLHALSSLLWRFLLFDRAAGFLPPRP
jgi:hypothetical protein